MLDVGFEKVIEDGTWWNVEYYFTQRMEEKCIRCKDVRPVYFFLHSLLPLLLCVKQIGILKGIDQHPGLVACLTAG